MKRILLRASSSPFDGMTNGPIPASHLLAVYEYLKNPGTRNTGNLLFAHATYKILSSNDVEIEIDDYKLTLDENYVSSVRHINDRYDAYVIPLCNSFRPEYKDSLERMTQVIKKLRIPCIVTGVGAQLSLNGNFDELSSIKGQVIDFVSSVLDRSESIGVRGEITGDYLAFLGFPRDRIDVIGCPSIFYNGDYLKIVKPSSIDRIALNFNITGIRDERILQFTSYFNSHHNNVTYVPQVRRLMPAVAKGDNPCINSEVTLDNMMPRVLQAEKILFFCDVPPWIKFMKTQSFSIGTRIHGNIVPLLAGTPSHVIAHDSRTLELAKYLDIPHTLISDLADFDAVRTFENSDYSKLMQGHKARANTFANFLQRNGLNHNLYNSFERDNFDSRVLRSFQTDRLPKEMTPIEHKILKAKRLGTRLLRLINP